MALRIIDMDARASITLGIFTAVAVALGMVLLALLHFLPGALVLFKEAVVAVPLGPVYMLMLAKVPRRGVFLVNGAALGLLFALTGFFTVGLVAVAGGLLADAVAATRGYRSPAANAAAYAVFRLGQAVGTYIPFYLWADSFVADLAASGRMDPEFLAVFTTSLTPGMGLAVLAANAAGALLGAAFGQAMLRRHFLRAGIVGPG
jgi:energy-coupling factor transport system substrate-specific component